MAKYKATKIVKDSKHIYLKLYRALKMNIGFEKTKSLLDGGLVEIDNFDSLPESVREHLVEDKPKRARNKKGQLVGDNPDTPDINEAYEGGKTPTKKKKKGDK